MYFMRERPPGRDYRTWLSWIPGHAREALLQGGAWGTSISCFYLVKSIMNLHYQKISEYNDFMDRTAVPFGDCFSIIGSLSALLKTDRMCATEFAMLR
jgi:hypothetical protein